MKCRPDGLEAVFSESVLKLDWKSSIVIVILIGSMPWRESGTAIVLRKRLTSKMGSIEAFFRMEKGSSDISVYRFI
jgi:hypothetical protein